MPQKKPSHSDIIQLRHKKQGHFRISADIHGNIVALKKNLADLSPDDTLILLGDLLDRGENSPGVIKAILEQCHKRPGSVLAIKGDHEDMFLKFYDAISKMAPLREEDHYAIQHFLKNGGNWVFRDFQYRFLFDQEVVRDLKTEETSFAAYYDYHLKNIIEDQRLKLFTKDLKKIADFLRPLPYVLYLPDLKKNGALLKKGFVAVHASLPFKDKELERRVGTELSPSEKRYITWSRPGELDFHRQRSKRSARLYTGHTVLLDPSCYLTILNDSKNVKAEAKLIDRSAHDKAALDKASKAFILNFAKQKNRNRYILWNQRIFYFSIHKPDALYELSLLAGSSFQDFLGSLDYKKSGQASEEQLEAIVHYTGHRHDFSVIPEHNAVTLDVSAYGAILCVNHDEMSVRSFLSPYTKGKARSFIETARQNIEEHLFLTDKAFFSMQKDWKQIKQLKDQLPLVLEGVGEYLNSMETQGQNLKHNPARIDFCNDIAATKQLLLGFQEFTKNLAEANDKAQCLSTFIRHNQAYCRRLSQKSPSFQCLNSLCTWIAQVACVLFGATVGLLLAGPSGLLPGALGGIALAMMITPAFSKKIVNGLSNALIGRPLLTASKANFFYNPPMPKAANRLSDYLEKAAWNLKQGGPALS